MTRTPDAGAPGLVHFDEAGIRRTIAQDLAVVPALDRRDAAVAFIGSSVAITAHVGRPLRLGVVLAVTTATGGQFGYNDTHALVLAHPGDEWRADLVRLVDVASIEARP